MEKECKAYLREVTNNTGKFYFDLMKQRVDAAAERNNEASKKRHKKIAALAATGTAIGLASLVLQIRSYLK